MAGYIDVSCELNELRAVVMADIGNQPYLVGDFEQADVTKDDQNCAQAVLKAYTSAMQRSLDERSAFKRQHWPTAPDTATFLRTPPAVPWRVSSAASRCRELPGGPRDNLIAALRR
jgi:hypothetical protein